MMLINKSRSHLSSGMLGKKIRDRHIVCEGNIFSFLFFAFVFGCLTGCGASEPQQKNYTSDNGSIEFSLEWVKPEKSEMTTNGNDSASYYPKENQTKEDSCSEYYVNEISAYLYDSSGNEIKHNKWDCAAGQGAFDSVKAGSNYQLSILAASSGSTRYKGETEKNITVIDNATTNAGKIYMIPTSNQIWKIESLSRGPMPIIATHSEKYLLVDIDGTNNVVQGSASYKWNFTANGQYYQIVSENGKCLEVDGAGKNDKDNVQVSSCGQGDHQLWEFIDRGVDRAGVHYYKIRAKHSTKCLDVESALTVDRTNVLQFTCRQ
jgi:hypothetical protein